MMVLGITGGIACGKSTVSARLVELGLVLVDADAIAHELAEPHKAIWQAYVDYFGGIVLNPDNTLNRQAVAARVFTDQKHKEWMNATMHPIIKQEILRRIEQAKAEGKNVVLDIPLLFEAHWEPYCDVIWVVAVDEETQIKRVIERDKTTTEDAKARISCQMPLSEKIKLADTVITTEISIENTRKQVDRAWNLVVKE